MIFDVWFSLLYNLIKFIWTSLQGTPQHFYGQGQMKQSYWEGGFSILMLNFSSSKVFYN